jgi:hypothetical protein
MKLNNCLFYAAWEAIKNDKYIVIRKTRHAHKWPFLKFHFLVVPKEIIDEHAISYVPVKDDLGDYPCPLFEGFIKKGDE